MRCDGCDKETDSNRCTSCSEQINRAKEMFKNNIKVGGIYSLSDIPDRCRDIALKEIKKEVNDNANNNNREGS